MAVLKAVVSIFPTGDKGPVERPPTRRDRIVKITVWSKFGKARSILRGESELIFGG